MGRKHSPTVYIDVIHAIIERGQFDLLVTVVRDFLCSADEVTDVWFFPHYLATAGRGRGRYRVGRS